MKRARARKYPLRRRARGAILVDKQMKHTDEKGQYVTGKSKAARAFRAKTHRVMGEFKAGTLHSGSKKGPEVTSRKQAIAIALSEARRGKKR